MKQEKPLIKKVIYNYFYCCYGYRGRLKRVYVVFEQNKITYCIEPLPNNLNKDNCLIKMSYNPVNMAIDEFIDYQERKIYRYHYNEICDKAINIINNHIMDGEVCDAILGSIEIYYYNGEKKVAKGLGRFESQKIEEIAYIFMPSGFIKLIEGE